MSEVSSTGQLGMSVRPDERAYCNYEEPVTWRNVGSFIHDTSRFLAQPNAFLQGELTRSVMRAVVDSSVLRAVVQDGMLDRPEAAAPLPTGEYMVYFAHNDGRREANGTSMFIEESVRAQPAAPAKSRNLSSGLRIVTRVSNPEQLHGLWGSTFGWDVTGCEQFTNRLANQGDIPPRDRTVWFSGIEDQNNVLVAAGMAERLDMPSQIGTVGLIESTEWGVDGALRGRGLMPHVIANLALIAHRDLRGIPHVRFAECNILSGAPKAALRAGYEVPAVEVGGRLVDQVLVDHVRVGDGLDPQGAYRNFQLMTLPEAQPC